MSNAATLEIDRNLQTIEDRLQSQPDQLIDFEAQKDLVRRILELREQKNALILGHNYMNPLVFQISSEGQRGDSLALSKLAAQSDNPLIVFNGVKFMAETAKLLNPSKKVLIADLNAGCSLADGINAQQAREYKRKHPNSPVVTYINSYADVKAQTDYCCTSSNAMAVIKEAAKVFGTKKIIFLPDTLMGQNLEYELEQEGSDLELVYPGKDDNLATKCEVHEQFTPDQLRQIREQYNMPRGAETSAVLVHWECDPEVLSEADFYGSTSQMSKYILEHPKLQKVYLATECEMAANLASEYPNVEFVRSCSFYCPHMRLITLDKLHKSLEEEVYEIEVDEQIAKRARKSIERMLSIK